MSDVGVRSARENVDEVKLVCKVKRKEDVFDRFRGEVRKDQELLEQEKPKIKIDPLLGLPEDEVVAGKLREMESLKQHGVFQEMQRCIVPT